MHPQLSQATYLDSMRGKKDYTAVKNVLDDALTGFRHRIGSNLKHENRRRGSLIFSHKTDFPCLKQPDGSPREAYYTILFMREFVRDVQQILLLEHLKQWRVDLTKTNDLDAFISEFGRIQQKIATILQQDVCSKEGLFFDGLVPPSNEEVASRLATQCDNRPFMMLGGCRPFPPNKL